MLSKRIYSDLSPDELDRRLIAFNGVRPTSAALQTDMDGKQHLYLAGWSATAAAAVVLLLQSGVPPTQVGEALILAKEKELAANTAAGGALSPVYTGVAVEGVTALDPAAPFAPGLAGVTEAAAPVLGNAPEQPTVPVEPGLDALLTQKAGNTSDPRQDGVSGYAQEDERPTQHRVLQEIFAAPEPGGTPEFKKIVAALDPDAVRVVYGRVSVQDARRLALAGVVLDSDEEALVGRWVREGLDRDLTQAKLLEVLG